MPGARPGEFQLTASTDLFTIVSLPLGAVVCVANLVGCMQTELVPKNLLDEVRGEYPYQWCERQMGDFSPGRFAWLLSAVHALSETVPFAGKQGLFEVPDELIYPKIFPEFRGQYA